MSQPVSFINPDSGSGTSASPAEFLHNHLDKERNGREKPVVLTWPAFINCGKTEKTPDIDKGQWKKNTGVFLVISKQQQSW